MNGVREEKVEDEVTDVDDIFDCGEHADECISIGVSEHGGDAFLSGLRRFQPAADDIPKEVSRDVGMEAVKLCEDVVMAMRAPTLDGPVRDILAPFSYDELVLGEFLGNGEFCNVYEVKAFMPSPKIDHSADEDKARNFLAKHAKREKTGDARYAIKHLRPELLASNKRFLVGAKDLALETQILACLQHPHIIKLRGVASEGTDGFSKCKATGYFLILDRLNDTLKQRICTWAKKQQKYQGSTVKKLMDRKGKKKRAFMANRLKVAFDISGALDHLHKNSIIFRDLKPDNCGFDVRGDVKLFDFGLAAEVPCNRDNDNQLFKLSGAGSLRYMAPEVALLKDYGLKVDVYSFSILLWQILALKTPFGGYSPRMFVDGVVIEGERPNLDPKWPAAIQNLLRIGWSEDSTVRPSMQTFYSALRREVAGFRNGDVMGLEHTRRRSTHILSSTFSL